MDDKSNPIAAQAARAARATVAVRARPSGDRALVASVGLISASMGNSRVPEKKPDSTQGSGQGKKIAVEIVPVPLAESIWKIPTG